MSIKSVTDSERPAYILRLNKIQIENRVRRFGFVEVAYIIRFLDLMCDTELDVADYLYIRNKIGSCLRHHDNHSDYFIPLRELAAELDCLT